jgi:hypothetical protein
VNRPPSEASTKNGTLPILRQIGFEILRDDLRDRLACSAIDRVRRYQPDTVVERVYLNELFGVVEVMVHGIDGELGAFRDEVRVELLPFSDLGFNVFPSALRPLREPGRRDRRGDPSSSGSNA